MFNEERIFITAKDGAKVFVVRNTQGPTPAKRAVILAHGLTGEPYEHLHIGCSAYLHERGYDVYRIAFYTGAPDARNLVDCTLQDHASDLNSLVEVLRTQYQSIFIAGHSYGGLTLLYAQPQVEALCFWDASFLPTWHKLAKEVPELGCYSVDWGGVTKLLGKPMYDEAKAITAEDSAKKAAQIKAPSMVIFAEPQADKNREPLFEHLTCEKEAHCVAGADHRFNTPGALTQLMELSERWFSKF